MQAGFAGSGWRRLAVVAVLGPLVLSCVADSTETGNFAGDEATAPMGERQGDNTAPTSVSIEDARTELIRELSDVEGVTMIGIGECDGKPCLRVYVVEITEETRKRIPASQSGWLVDLRRSGQVRARH